MIKPEDLLPKTCFEAQEKYKVSCDQKSCRHWIEYEEDLNCSIVCARKHDNGLSVREVAKRIGVSFPRISQIEKAVFKKLTKHDLLDFD
tara:strand:- start:809 stop:1075 length:267 start_codon:yes stop_codon:yes gene_type:complete